MSKSGSGEAGRGKIQPRTLTIRENRSRVISLERQNPDPYDLDVPHHERGQLDNWRNIGLLCCRVEGASSPSSRDRTLTAASLALGSWPRSHFTHHREADTSGLGCVV